MTLSEKPQSERIKESIEILKHITNLGIPYNSPEVIELRTYLDPYIKDGICWSGSISFLRFGRIAEITLPRRADKHIEITLRIPRTSR